MALFFPLSATSGRFSCVDEHIYSEVYTHENLLFSRFYCLSLYYRFFSLYFIVDDVVVVFLHFMSLSTRCFARGAHFLAAIWFGVDLFRVCVINCKCLFMYELSYLRFGTAVAACIGGGTVYGNGNFAATAGFSNSIFIAWFWLKLNCRFSSMMIFLLLRSMCGSWLLLMLPACADAAADGIVDTAPSLPNFLPLCRF